MTTMWPMPAAVAPPAGRVAFNDGDLHAGFGKLARAGASGDACADDHDIERVGQN